MVQKYRGKIQLPLKLVEQGYADLFPTRRLIKINNLPLLKPSERLQGSRNLYRNIGGKIQTPLKLVERDYADLFRTRKHMEINYLPLLRSPKTF